MYTLTVPAMSCSHCQQTITGAVLALDGNATLNFDMAGHKVTLDTVADIADLKHALDVAGYPVEAVEEKPADGGHHCELCG